LEHCDAAATLNLAILGVQGPKTRGRNAKNVVETRRRGDICNDGRRGPRLEERSTLGAQTEKLPGDTRSVR